MAFLEWLRSSPWLKMILTVLSMILSGTAATATTQANCNAQMRAMEDGVSSGYSATEMVTVSGTWFGTIVTAVLALLANSGAAQTQITNLNTHWAAIASKDPNAKWLAQFQSWDFLLQTSKGNEPLIAKLNDVGVLLVEDRTRVKIVETTGVTKT